MKVRKALLSGNHYGADVAERMWTEVGGHGFDYLGASFSSMRGGSFDADVGIAGVSCSFTLDFPDAASLRAFVAIAPLSTQHDEEAATQAYRRIGAAAGLEHCLAALHPYQEGR